MTAKSIIEHWASEGRGLTACPDFTKCGSCWKEKLRSDVAREYLEAGKIADTDLRSLYEEVHKRWIETAVYKEVRAMQATGKSIDEIEKIMYDKGISI